MKREFLQNIKVLPYTSGEVVEKRDFLSGVLGASIATAGDLTVTITHSADGEDFESVADTKIFVDAASNGGVLTVEGLKVGDSINFDVDLLGLKAFIKFVLSGTAATDAKLAVALGDSAIQPI